MKTRLFVLLSLPFFSAFTGLAQEGMRVTYGDKPANLSECKITYEVSFPEGIPSSVDAASLPTEKVLYLKNNLMRIETKTKTGTTVMIVDAKNKTANTLSELNKVKYAVQTTPTDVENEQANIPRTMVQGSDDFKIIAGYNCQKFLYSITFIDNKTLTPDIYVFNNAQVSDPNWYDAAFKEIKRLMFEYSAYQNGVVIKYLAKSVEPLKENDGIFTIPAGYKNISKNDFIIKQKLEEYKKK